MLLKRPHAVLALSERCAVHGQADTGLAQGMLLTAYMKLLVAEPQNTQLKSGVEEVYERYSRHAPAMQHSARVALLPQHPLHSARV